MRIFFAPCLKAVHMSQPLPPLPALRAFAALVRLGSVAAAAEELSLTPGAISHQIRALESYLGLSLVDRSGRSLSLSDEGRIYGYQVRQALEDISLATDQLRQRPSGGARRLRLSVLPSFAAGWLMPRLPSFMAAHPEVHLHLAASMSLVDLRHEPLDAAIRFGHGQWPEAQVQALMSDQLMLIASPQWGQDLSEWTLAQALRLPLLQASESWSAFMSAAGSEAVALERPAARLQFTDSTHLVDAAGRGLGLALTRRSVADAALRDGRVVQVTPHRCLHPSQYFVLRPPQLAASPALQSFLAWLAVQVEGWQAGSTSAALHVRKV